MLPANPKTPAIPVKTFNHSTVCCCLVATILLLVMPFRTYAAYTADGAELAAAIVSKHKLQRQKFIELRGMISNGRHDQAAARVAELDGYPLKAHLQYLVLRKQIKNSDNPLSMLGSTNRYLQQYNDRKAHRRLLGVLKNRAVELERWSDYSAVAKADNAPIHPCDDLLAQVRNKRIKSFSAGTAKLWSSPSKHTGNCDIAFAALIKMTGDVPTGALWRRTVALLTRGELDKARQLLRFYNNRDRKIVQQWLDQINKPADLLQSKSLRGTGEHHRRLAKYLLRRWRRDDLSAATEFWLNHGSDFGFSSAEISATVNSNAVLAAKRGMPQAGDLLHQATVDSRDVRYWRVRMALRSLDWQAALKHLDNLPVAEQKLPRWQYWRARSLNSLGFVGAAEKIYRQLATKFEYHGFLAADQLGIPYRIDVSEPTINKDEVDKFLSNPKVERSIEYFLANIGWEGRGSWNGVLKDASDQQLIAAAHVALSIGWYDRAYAAIKRSSQKSALAFLFPTPYQELVSRTAAEHIVNESFVYGVMRQESGFIPDVRSPAGAVGLMQLMPGTAKDMGKKLGLKAPVWKLIDSELNIRLGIAYLNFVLQRFDNSIVLAAAAYNAGPHRVERWVERWVEGESLPADVWVETIPFDETRKYVRRVLFNATVSDWRLQSGALTRLRIRMPDVLPLG